MNCSMVVAAIDPRHAGCHLTPVHVHAIAGDDRHSAFIAIDSLHVIDCLLAKAQRGQRLSGAVAEGLPALRDRYGRGES